MHLFLNIIIREPDFYHDYPVFFFSCFIGPFYVGFLYIGSFYSFKLRTKEHKKLRKNDFFLIVIVNVLSFLRGVKKCYTTQFRSGTMGLTSHMRSQTEDLVKTMDLFVCPFVY